MIERREVTFCVGCMDEGVNANCRLLRIDAETDKRRCDRCKLPTFNGYRLVVEIGHLYLVPIVEDPSVEDPEPLV